MIRSFLDGRFENTAFCLLAPDGKEKLSRTGRAPRQVFRTGRRRGGKKASTEITVAELEKVAKEYKLKGEESSAVLQDFHSFRQALNVASGDQRLLIFVSTPVEKQEAIRKTLAPLMVDSEIIGRFHLDWAGGEVDEKWKKAIGNVDADSESEIFVIQADKFGLKGQVLDQLAGDAAAEQIKTALLESNAEFAGSEERKVYSDHVAQGRKERVHFETNIEYGEDRDGDGKIDRRGGGRRRGGR